MPDSGQTGQSSRVSGNLAGSQPGFGHLAGILDGSDQISGRIRPGFG